MKRLWVVVLGGLAACAPSLGGLPPAVHPTGRAGQTSVGVAAGGMLTLDETEEGGDDVAQLVIPWGEGWARWGAGNGQLELHILPSLASIGYRIDVAPMGPGMGFALVPAGQAGWTHVWQDEAGGDESNQGLLVLGGNLTGILLFPTGTGFFYVAPRIGINNLRVVGDAPEQADSVNLLTFGGAIGIDMGGQPGSIGVSFELSVQRSSNMDSDDGSTPLWFIAPTLGLKI